MKKFLSAVLALTLVFCLAVSSFAANVPADYEAKAVKGVPTVFLPESGTVISDASGKELFNAESDFVILTSVSDFNDAETQAYKLLKSEKKYTAACDNNGAVDTSKSGNFGSYDIYKIFKLNLAKDASDVLNQTVENSVTFLFDINLTTVKEYFVLQYIDDNWTLLSYDDCAATEYGLALTLHYEGIIAILAIRNDYTYKPEEAPSIIMTGHPQLETVGYTNLVEEEVPDNEIETVSAMQFNDEELAAYKELANAQSVKSVCDNYDEVINAMANKPGKKDVVVRDVFACNALGETEKNISSGDNKLEVGFDYSIKEGDFLMVLSYDQGKWTALDPDDYSVKDGSVSVSLHKSGLLAFAVAN